MGNCVITETLDRRWRKTMGKCEIKKIIDGYESSPMNRTKCESEQDTSWEIPLKEGDIINSEFCCEIRGRCSGNDRGGDESCDSILNSHIWPEEEVTLNGVETNIYKKKDPDSLCCEERTCSVSPTNTCISPFSAITNPDEIKLSPDDIIANKCCTCTTCEMVAESVLIPRLGVERFDNIHEDINEGFINGNKSTINIEMATNIVPPPTEEEINRDCNELKKDFMKELNLTASQLVFYCRPSEDNLSYIVDAQAAPTKSRPLPPDIKKRLSEGINLYGLLIVFWG